MRSREVFLHAVLAYAAMGENDLARASDDPDTKERAPVTLRRL